MILISELNARSVPYMYVNTVSNELFILIIKYSIYNDMGEDNVSEMLCSHI